MEVGPSSILNSDINYVIVQVCIAAVKSISKGILLRSLRLGLGLGLDHSDLRISHTINDVDLTAADLS